VTSYETFCKPTGQGNGHVKNFQYLQLSNVFIV